MGRSYGSGWRVEVELEIKKEELTVVKCNISIGPDFVTTRCHSGEGGVDSESLRMIHGMTRGPSNSYYTA
jgi:hypothetical protein